MSPSSYTPTGTRSVIPDRSLEQRRAALARGNAIRSARAVVKRDLKAGEADPVAVLRANAGELDTMRVEEFVRAIRWMGHKKTAALLASARIAPTKTIGGLTRRQYVDLEWHLFHRFADPGGDR